jgi:hypothetical protein
LQPDLLALLRDFCRDADCAGFLRGQAGYFRAVDRAMAHRGDPIDQAWFRRFFALPPTETYRPVLSLMGASDLGYVRVNHGGERRATYTVVAVKGMDRQGLPTALNQAAMERLNLHETAHAYANQLVDRNLARLQRPAEILLRRPATWTRVKDSFYNNAPFLMRETFVRAVAIKYAEAHGGGPSVREREIAEQEQAGFVWMRAFVEQLDAYERDRARYKTLQDFLPALIACLDAAAAGQARSQG